MAQLNVLELINNFVKCIDVTMHLWSGRRKLRAATVHMGESEVDAGKVTAPQGKLLSPAWAKKFSEVQGAKARLVRQHSLPHMAPGWAAVRSNNLGSFVEELSRIRTQLHTVRDSLIDNYEQDIVAWNRQQWGELFYPGYKDGERVPGIEELLPTREELRTSIDMSWIILDVQPGSIELSGASSEQVEELRTMTRNMMQTQVDDFVEQLLRGPREQLQENVSRLAATINGMQLVTPSTFQAIQNSVKLLKEFHDLPSLRDDVLLEKIAVMEAQIDNLPNVQSYGQQRKSLDISAEVGQGLVTAMNNVAAACLDDAALTVLRAKFLQETGRHRRAMA